MNILSILTKKLLQKTTEAQLIDEIFTRLDPVTVLHHAKLRAEDKGLEIIVRNRL